MSETPEVTQAEMPGMPESTIVPSFLHVCEVGVNDLALTVALMNLFRSLPGTDDGDAELFAKSAEKAGRYVREQVGRRAFDDAFDKALERMATIMEKAKIRTAKEGYPRWPAHHLSGDTYEHH